MGRQDFVLGKTFMFNDCSNFTKVVIVFECIEFSAGFAVNSDFWFLGILLWNNPYFLLSFLGQFVTLRMEEDGVLYFHNFLFFGLFVMLRREKGWVVDVEQRRHSATYFVAVKSDMFVLGQMKIFIWQIEHVMFSLLSMRQWQRTNMHAYNVVKRSIKWDENFSKTKFKL